MTYTEGTCIRGCKQKPRLGDDGEPMQPQPRRAVVGLLCQQCADRLAEALEDIPDLYAVMRELDPHDTRSAGDQAKTHSRKVSGSPALIRLDLLVLEGNGGRGGVWKTIADWVYAISHETGITEPEHDIVPMIEWLKLWNGTITKQPTVADYWTDITSVLRDLRRATNTKPVGRCFGRITNKPCGRLIYPPANFHAGNPRLVCPDPTCGRVYTGADVLKVQIQFEKEEGA